MFLLWKTYYNQYFAGKCHGNLIHLEDSATKEECLTLCKSTDGTTLFIFIAGNAQCHIKSIVVFLKLFLSRSTLSQLYQYLMAPLDAKVGLKVNKSDNWHGIPVENHCSISSEPRNGRCTRPMGLFRSEIWSIRPPILFLLPLCAVLGILSGTNLGLPDKKVENHCSREKYQSPLKICKEMAIVKLLGA